MPLTAAELRAVYSVDERPLDRSLAGLPGKVGRVGDATERTTSRMSGAMRTAAGAIGGFFAFGAVKSGVMGLVGPASDLTQTVSKSNAIFGQNAAAIRSWAQNAANQFGLSRQQALSAAAGFGDMFSQLGFAGGKAADMSKAVVQMSADLGAFNDLPTAEVAEMISAAFRGEYDSLQRLVPNINAARVEQEALGMSGKKSAEDLTAAEKAAATLAIVQKDGARAAGAFARESDSASGAAARATAQWADQRAEIGQALLPAFTAFMGFLSGTVIPGVGALAAFVSGTLVPGFQALAGWIAANQTPITIVAGLIAAVLLPGLIALGLTSLRAAAQNVAAWLLIKASSIAGAVAHSAAVVGMVAKWALLGVQSMARAAMVAAAWLVAMGPVGWVIAAVVGVVGLIIANWSKVKAFTLAAWKAVSGAVVGAWNWIKGATAAAAAWIVGRVQAIRSGIVSAFTNAMAFVQSIPGRIRSIFAAAGSWLISAGGDIIRGLWNGIQGLAGWLWDKIVGWAGGLVDGVLNFFGISSPSKVMADIGKNLVLGMAKGIDRNGQQAVKSALRTARGVRDAMTVTAPGMGMSGMGAPAMAGATGGIGADAGGRGALFTAGTVNVIEGTPTDVARQLELGARTRGNW